MTRHIGDRFCLWNVERTGPRYADENLARVHEFDTPRVHSGGTPGGVGTVRRAVVYGTTGID
jgi:hypothetical protein